MTNNWNDVHFPKDEWSFVGIDDTGPIKLQEPPIMCGMCGTKQIRYVHNIVHSTQGKLGVGCECASHLLGEDSEKCKRREKFSQKKWVAVQSTTEAHKTSIKVKKAGVSTTYNLKVWRFYGWCLSINGHQVIGNYKTLDGAKYGGFEQVCQLSQSV